MKSNNSDASKKVNPSHQCGIGQGAHDAGKPTEPREGNGYHCGRATPKPEKVRELPLLNPDKKAVECAREQNTMDDGQLAQVPAGREFPTRVKPE